jgi:hypothetical protein
MAKQTKTLKQNILTYRYSNGTVPKNSTELIELLKSEMGGNNG